VPFCCASAATLSNSGRVRRRRERLMLHPSYVAADWTY
jgi:hypothetical protein